MSAPRVDAGHEPDAPAPGPAPASDADPRHRRGIRSYVLRRSHFSPAQRDAYARLMPRFGVPFAERPIDQQALFGRRAPLVLEIGFGMGDTTAEIARAAPAFDFLAVDVHTPGVGALLKRIEQDGLTNVRVIEHDATAVVEAMIGLNTLAGVHVFFPDPWPKLRHHKRRLLQQHFVTKLIDRLRVGGWFHFATDWPDYARQVADILDAKPGLAEKLASPPLPPPWPPTSWATSSPLWKAVISSVPTADETGAAQAHWLPGTRPPTRFEARGQRLGHPITDLVRIRVSAKQSLQ